jgi:hypothetical protein
MVAYHNDRAIKEKYLSRVRAHRAADELVHGEYWKGGKGCAVGCTIHSGNHAAYETKLGVPEVLARLEDAIFEHLPPPESLSWPDAFLSAIPVGADLSLVWPRFAAWLLVDSEAGVSRFAGDRADVRAAIEGVSALYLRWVESGAQPPAEEFSEAARSAAEAAAKSEAAEAEAAWAAAEAAWEVAEAVWAARSAAAAAWEVAEAARSAAAAATSARAWAQAWALMAAKLLELLAAAPVIAERDRNRAPTGGVG